MDNLPTEVLTKIFDFIPFYKSDWLSIILTCKLFCNVGLDLFTYKDTRSIKWYLKNGNKGDDYTDLFKVFQRRKADEHTLDIIKEANVFQFEKILPLIEFEMIIKNQSFLMDYYMKQNNLPMIAYLVDKLSNPEIGNDQLLKYMIDNGMALSMQRLFMKNQKRNWKLEFKPLIESCVRKGDIESAKVLLYHDPKDVTEFADNVVLISLRKCNLGMLKMAVQHKRLNAMSTVKFAVVITLFAIFAISTIAILTLIHFDYI